jgi:hypothetical protein
MALSHTCTGAGVLPAAVLQYRKTLTAEYSAFRKVHTATHEPVVPYNIRLAWLLNCCWLLWGGINMRLQGVFL